MVKIEIPMNPWSKERIKREMKYATTRSKQYGKPGDWFEVDGKVLELEFIAKLPLFFITEYLYRTEGAESPEEFQKIWREIHPRKSWDSMMAQEYYYHFFSHLQGSIEIGTEEP